MGRRTAATGIPAPAGGLVQPGCTPHFSFALPKEKRAVHGPKRKALGALRCSGPPRARESAYRCLLRFCLTFGHARLFYEVDTAVPWRMVPRSSGCKDAFDQLLFPRVPLRYALPRAVVEGVALSYAEAFINHQVSGSEKRRSVYPRPPRANGLPKGGAFPSLTAARDSQPSPAGGRRSAQAQTDPPNIFSFPPGAAHFLFDVSKRKWGAHPAWTMPPGGSQAPEAAVRRPTHFPWGGNLPHSAPEHRIRPRAYTIPR